MKQPLRHRSSKRRIHCTFRSSIYRCQISMSICAAVSLTSSAYDGSICPSERHDLGDHEGSASTPQWALTHNTRGSKCSVCTGVRATLRWRKPDSNHRSRMIRRFRDRLMSPARNSGQRTYGGANATRGPRGRRAPSAGPMVRIRLPPAESRTNSGTDAAFASPRVMR